MKINNYYYVWICGSLECKGFTVVVHWATRGRLWQGHTCKNNITQLDVSHLYANSWMAICFIDISRFWVFFFFQYYDPRRLSRKKRFVIKMVKNSLKYIVTRRQQSKLRLACRRSSSLGQSRHQNLWKRLLQNNSSKTHPLWSERRKKGNVTKSLVINAQYNSAHSLCHI